LGVGRERREQSKHGENKSNAVVSIRLPRAGEPAEQSLPGVYASRVTWAGHAERAERRFAEGQDRLPAEPEPRQKQLVRMAMAATSAGLARLMQGRDDEAAEWFLRSAECYRESWNGAPEGSWGRPTGALKALILAGDVTAAVEAGNWAASLGGSESDSAIGRYSAALAALVLGHDDEAASLAEELGRDETFPASTAAALAALARREAARYREAVTAVLVDFEARTEFLEDVPVADTVLVLERLAERRGLAVRLSSSLLPAKSF
jgi:hypothetical protein